MFRVLTLHGPKIVGEFCDMTDTANYKTAKILKAKLNSVTEDTYKLTTQLKNFLCTNHLIAFVYQIFPSNAHQHRLCFKLEPPESTSHMYKGKNNKSQPHCRSEGKRRHESLKSLMKS